MPVMCGVLRSSHWSATRMRPTYPAQWSCKLVFCPLTQKRSPPVLMRSGVLLRTGGEARTRGAALLTVRGRGAGLGEASVSPTPDWRVMRMSFRSGCRLGPLDPYEAHRLASRLVSERGEFVHPAPPFSGTVPLPPPRKRELFSPKYREPLTRWPRVPCLPSRT